MKTLLRFATTAVASTALIAGGATFASAETPATTQAASVAPDSARAAAVSTGGVTKQGIDRFAFRNGYLVGKSNPISGTIAITVTKPVSWVTTAVTVNGRARGSVPVQYTDGIYLPGSVGPGKVVLGPTTIKYADGTREVDPTLSNAFYFRRDTFGKFKVRHSGKKVKMSIRAQVRGNDGSRDSARRAKVQYKKGSKWKTLKTVKLNSKGVGSYKYSTKSKRNYRLVVAKTSTVAGMTIKLRKV